MDKDGRRESVNLKNFEYLGKVGVQSSDALKQLRLSSGGVTVYVDLHLMLYTSPFLSTLVEDLRDCCISGHDEVEILLEPISPDLLHHFKSLVEIGECWVKSQHDKEGLEDLFKELGMDLVLTLLMGGKGEESCANIVISDYEELDDCVEIDGHSSSVGCEKSQTPSEETVQDNIADNRSQNEIEESSFHKRKLNGNCTEVILSAVKRKCLVKMDQQNSNEENGVIVKKQFSLNENLHLSKDGVVWENKPSDKQQDFIEKYIEEHIRKNSVEISETSVNVVKPDSTNVPPKDENCDEILQCQICQHGNFTENDLFEHLYKNHIGLQRKINKSFAKQVPSYYTLERNKKRFSCPICGQVMKAVRQKVGLHWAVDHKQIQKFYEEEINEKKRQELLNSAQGSSDEVSQGTKEKGMETKLLRRKAEVHVGIKKTEEKRRKVEVHDLCVKKPEEKVNLTFVVTESPGKAKLADVGMQKTEEKGRKVEVPDSGVKKTNEKCNLTFVETESPKKAEVPDVGLNMAEEKDNSTFDFASQDEQVSPLQVMRNNWQKKVQSFVTNITTAKREIVLEKGELLFPTNTVSDNSQEVTETNHLEKSKPFQESRIDQGEVVEKANGSSSLETDLNINTDKKESVVVLKSLEESMADQEKIDDKEKASFTFRRNIVNNIKENSLPKEPKMLKDWFYGDWVVKDSMIEHEKNVIKEKESSSPKINVSNSNADKKENSLVKDSSLLQDSMTGQEKFVKSRNELVPSKITIRNNNGHKKEENLVKEAQLSQYSMNKQELLGEKSASLGLCTKNPDICPMDTIVDTLKNPDICSMDTIMDNLKNPDICPMDTIMDNLKNPDICFMDTIVDNLKDMDELGTAIIIREASRHRIQNSTGKLKQQLVEELWDHYQECHSVHLKFQCKQSDQKVDFEDKRNYYSHSLRAQIFPELDSDSESD